MTDFVKGLTLTPPIINSLSFNSVGPMLSGAQVSFNTTTAWPSTNLAIYIPFYLGAVATFVKMFWVNGSTVGTNNVDVGIYDSEGTRIVSSGSILTSGASALQEANITDVTLQPGIYYLAMAMDGTTDTIQSTNTSTTNSQGFFGAMGLYNQASAFNLPATATFAAATNRGLPMVGATTKTTI